MSHRLPMGSRGQFPCLVCLLLLLVEIAGSRSLRRNGERQKVKALSHLDTSYETSDPYYDVGSPFSMPPYGDAMGPASSSAQDYPPFCIYPPFTPMPPTIIPYLPSPPPPESANPPEFPVPSPPVYIPGPPETVPSPAQAVPSPPETVPSPPEAVPSPSPPVLEPNPPTTIPSPTGFVPSPPTPSFAIPGTPGFLPSPPPPSYTVPGTPESVPSPPQPVYVFPSPPGLVPSPPEFVPGPPIFLPPVVYPSPAALPPPMGAQWCVAKPTVPDPIIEEAMNYACASGADCDSIQPSGPCYEPNTMIGHASYAFNSYWQRTKVAGGTCDFGRTAMLVTKDPSYDGCHFIIF